MGTLNVNLKKRRACGVCLLLVCHAPQCGLCDAVEDIFYEQLSLVTVIIPASEFFVPCDLEWSCRQHRLGLQGSTRSQLSDPGLKVIKLEYILRLKI